MVANGLTQLAWPAGQPGLADLCILCLQLCGCLSQYVCSQLRKWCISCILRG